MNFTSEISKTSITEGVLDLSSPRKQMQLPISNFTTIGHALSFFHPLRPSFQEFFNSDTEMQRISRTVDEESCSDSDQEINIEDDDDDVDETDDNENAGKEPLKKSNNITSIITSTTTSTTITTPTRVTNFTIDSIIAKPSIPNRQLPVQTCWPSDFYSPYRRRRANNNNNDNLTKGVIVKKYKCDICNKSFSRSNTLVTHRRIHTGEKPFACDVCGRAFRQPGNLTRHKLTHTTVKPYACHVCGKAFNRASNLHTHMRTHQKHGAIITTNPTSSLGSSHRFFSRMGPYFCQICNKRFDDAVDMKIHSYTHTTLMDCDKNRVESTTCTS